MNILVILCSYNGEKYLEEQVESVLMQTEPDVKLLISDDCSTDRTALIARDYERKYPEQVRVAEREQPSGSAAAHFMDVLLNGAEDFFPDVEYVMFADQDDIWHPDKVKKTLRAMKDAERRFGASCPILAHCDMRIVTETGRELSPSFVQYQKMSPKRRALRQLLLQNNVTGGALMMNRALRALCEAGGMPKHMVMHDHWIALIASAFGKIVFIPEALYDYRQHGSNALGAKKGSCVREIADRLGLFRADGKTRKEMDADSKQQYQNLFLQAESLEIRYGSLLGKDEKKVLSTFLSLKSRNRLSKILLMLRYGFTFNRFHRTVGACLFM